MQWRTPVIAVAWEAEAGGSKVQSQPQQKRGPKPLGETLSLNKMQNRAGDVVQWLSAPEFNSQLPKRKKKTFKKTFMAE